MLKIQASNLVLAFLIFVGITLASASAKEPVPVVLIFDSSGSMAAKLPDGRSKIEAARTIVADTLNKWPTDGKLALVAYGHRRKNDCSDIETILKMAPVSGHAIEKSLAALRPRGKTPISQSLRMAAGMLPQSGGAIVLVSDGIDTCNADPCAEAAALKNANAKLIIHVVGFGLAMGEAKKLSCIADQTGGKFFDVNNATELADSLSTVTNEIVEPAPPPPIEILPPSAPVPQTPILEIPKAPEIVRVSLVARAGELGPIVNAPVHWIVQSADGNLVYEGDSRGLFLDLAVGQYNVTAEAANTRGAAQIKVEGKIGEIHDVNVIAGRLDLSVVTNLSNASLDDVTAAGLKWTLTPMEGQTAITMPTVARPSLLLAPGLYKVDAQLKGLFAHDEVRIASGTATAVQLDFKLGTVVLEAAMEPTGPEITDATLLRWKIGNAGAEQSIVGQARPRLLLQEGTYPVMLNIAGSDVAATATVSSNAEKIVRVIVGGGEIALSARLGPQSPALDDWRDAFWTLNYIVKDTSVKPLELQEAAPLLPLFPGTWRVRIASGTVFSEQDVVVIPGKRAPIVFILNAARLTLGTAHNSGPSATNIVFSIFAVSADGVVAQEPVFRSGSSDTVSTILSQGHWHVIVADSESRQGEADLILQAGENRRTEINLR